MSRIDRLFDSQPPTTPPEDWTNHWRKIRNEIAYLHPEEYGSDEMRAERVYDVLEDRDWEALIE